MCNLKSFSVLILNIPRQRPDKRCCFNPLASPRGELGCVFQAMLRRVAPSSQVDPALCVTRVREVVEQRHPLELMGPEEGPQGRLERVLVA